MTHAYLPGPNIIAACSLARARLSEARKHEQLFDEIRLENIAKGRLPPERAERDSSDAAIWRKLLHDEACVERITALASAVGDGTLAVDAEDFLVIAQHYRN